jgi:hypothetical protein
VPRKTFVAGEILTAADVNSNLMDQAVMVFNDAAARDTAIPSPIEGMVVYLKDTDGLLSYSGTAWVPAASGASLGAGSILQVVQTLMTDTFNTSSTTFTAITGASVSITPRATSSKIMILGTTFLGFATGGSNGRAPYIRISGGNISSYVGDADGSRTRAVGTTGVSSASYAASNANGFTSFSYLDSPNTSSSITYQLELMSSNAGAVAYVGRAGTDNNDINWGRFPTTIIAMEVAG